MMRLGTAVLEVPTVTDMQAIRVWDRDGDNIVFEAWVRERRRQRAFAWSLNYPHGWQLHDMFYQTANQNHDAWNQRRVNLRVRIVR